VARESNCAAALEDAVIRRCGSAGRHSSEVLGQIDPFPPTARIDGTLTRIRETCPMEQQRCFSTGEARRIGEQIGIDWDHSPFDVEQFRMGLAVELEHGRRDPATNVSDDDELTTGKIAWAHLNEFPDYYTRLAEMESEAERYWSERRGG
jgi:hypothetical protein